MRRRDFLAMPAASAAWKEGEVRHILPTVSHDRALFKVSYANSQLRAPRLRIAGRELAGERTDTRGEFWHFDVTGLKPETEYRIAITGCDPFPLRTFPAPEAKPARFRLLIYTCAGGDERVRDARGRIQFLSIATRGRLLDRAMTFQPDAVIANGDHIYWDLRQGSAPPRYAEDVLAETGRFVRDLPVLGTANEEVLKRVAHQQIARLYSTRFRSTPVFFLADDHDHFENDDADAKMVTFPPDHLMVQLVRATRRFYYPEFLPDANRPAGLPGASAVDAPPGCGESFGTLRYGRLLEVLLYDCRRFLTLAGPNAVIVPAEAERWLTSRLADPAPSHMIQLPSMPPAWSAGKWGDWYPDKLGQDGKLTTTIPKPFWQPGWAAQHDRLMQAASMNRGRRPVVISGDLHALAYSRMMRAGEIDLSANPIDVLLAGPVSTGTGWPSNARGTRPAPALHVTLDEKQPCLEENGFTILDVAEDKMTARMFRWLPAQGEAAIDSLQPFAEFDLPRPS
jgi:phosphodiesterase/alkaline phosphatase D-like protein